MEILLRDEDGKKAVDPDKATISSWLRDVLSYKRGFLIMEASESTRFAQCDGTMLEYGEDGRLHRYRGDWDEWLKLLVRFAEGERLPATEPDNWSDVTDEIP